ncbi:hypothetical protein LCGC14_1162850 [marine sediment metagenome]|uniref:Uncharacterized protein n=1 Tax=marine sediment metagenome TaxID=412755 RepID=A0A0F9PAE3_9ZZZZ|nr:hypothetical protein [Candidatus Scalindua sp.]
MDDLSYPIPPAPSGYKEPAIITEKTELTVWNKFYCGKLPPCGGNDDASLYISEEVIVRRPRGSEYDYFVGIFFIYYKDHGEPELSIGNWSECECESDSYSYRINPLCEIDGEIVVNPKFKELEWALIPR